MAPARKDSPLTLACILITILLDMVGYGIIVPVLDAVRSTDSYWG